MADQIRLRRDTLANWEFVNPVLALGEPGIELNEIRQYTRIKYGDGVRHWIDLPYASVEGYIGNRFVNFNEPNDIQSAVSSINTIGNAGTVTNGVYTTGNYNNPSWITHFDYSKLLNVPIQLQSDWTEISNLSASFIRNKPTTLPDPTKLALSGGILTGDLTIYGRINALSGSTFTNTIFTNTSALSVVNVGAGPALYVYQGPGAGDVASFYDGDGIEVLHIGNALNPIATGVVGIKTSYPNKTLTVIGDVSASSSIWGEYFYGNASNLTNIPNASTVTNGVYTIGNQSISGVKTFTSNISGSITGNASTVTNGVYTTGNQSISGVKTFTSNISGSITGNASTVTNGVYTTSSYSDPSWIVSLAETKVLPSQTNNSGKYLYTNGSSTSWNAVTATLPSTATFTNVTVTSKLSADNVSYGQLQQEFGNISNATGTVTHDCNRGLIFNHTTPAANFTVNLTNLIIDIGYTVEISVIINQGSTARLPTSVQITGAAQTINWLNKAVPTGTINGIDRIKFRILRLATSTYTVLGEYQSFDTVSGGG